MAGNKSWREKKQSKSMAGGNKSWRKKKQSNSKSSATSTSMETGKSSMTLKLFIDTKRNRVVFGEAGKDVIDFLFPKETICTFMNLSQDYTCIDHESKSNKKKLYRCGYADTLYCTGYVTEYRNAFCPSCSHKMNMVMIRVAPPPQNMSYMVMDDLEVKRTTSNISSVVIQNRFNVEDLGDLEQRVVHIGDEEARKLRKCSLISDEVLTTAFLEEEEA